MLICYLLSVFLCIKSTSTKGTIGPGRGPLAYLLYYVIMVSPPVHKYSSWRSTSWVQHQATSWTSLSAAGSSSVCEGSVSSFKSI